MAEVLKEGFLVKKGHVRHNWRTRWFVLLKQELLYFRTKEDRIPAGTIPLNGATLICPPCDSSKKPWLLNLTTSDSRQYLIQAPDQLTRDEWKLVIEDSIRKLDPAKAHKEMSPTRTLVRTEEFITTSEALRDIVQAMQDPNAGVKLKEFRTKGNGSQQNTMYFFTGKEAVDWLISWAFAEDRLKAIALASEMLHYGFLNPIHLDQKENVYKRVRDSLLTREMVDSQDANYDFVVFAPGESMDLFSPEEEDEQEESGSDSDSDEDILATRSMQMNAVDVHEGKVLKQGFLLKKGKRRHNWKARKFVLREKQPILLYFKGSKGKRAVGGIPLKDLTVIDKDVESGPGSYDKSTNTSCVGSRTTNSLPYRKNSTNQMRNRIVLLTATGVRYELEASNADDRDSWSSQIKVAAKLLS